MFRKFASFAELAGDFGTRSGIAIRYADDSGSVREISYPELAGLIESELCHVRAVDPDVHIFRTDSTPETAVGLLAGPTAGCDLILAGPSVPDDFAEWAEAMASAAREERLSRRDSRGRLSYERNEGELLFFTSGTTSRSKIVRLTPATLCTSAWSGQSMLPCGEGDVILSVLPFSHVFGFVCSLLWGLAYGATIALGRGADRLADDIQLFRPTIIPAVPSIVSGMLQADAFNPELRTVLIGGAPCPPDDIAALRAKGIDVYIGYGLTETASGIAITQDLSDPEALYPCPGADIHVEDDGRITVSTPCMMEGYIGDIPMFEGDHFYTGDIGWFDDDGHLRLKGRNKDVLLLPDGTKIFCPEPEEALSRKTSLPDLGLTLRDGRAVLIAGSCTSDPDTEKKIRTCLLKAVDAYNKDLPPAQQISDVIVTGEALPRTATGKLKRHELNELMLSKADKADALN